MSNEAKEYVEALQRKVEQFRKAMTAESDRGCALFGAVYLDVSLSDLLYVSLVENKKLKKICSNMANR